MRLCNLLEGDLPSIERHSCYDNDASMMITVVVAVVVAAAAAAAVLVVVIVICTD